MSVPRELLCAVLDHDSRAFCGPTALDLYARDNGFYVDADHDIVLPSIRTLGDLVNHLDAYHSWGCDCGLKLSTSVWRVDLPFGQDCDAALAWYEPQDSELLDCSLPLQTVFPAQHLPKRMIHFIIGTEGRLPKPQPSGLRRLGGDLSRLAGSRELILPDTSDFRDIILRRPGCFYIDRFDWVADRFGPDLTAERPPIPIIRRPPGFGKTTFLTAFASYFDMSVNEYLFPCLRVFDRGRPRMLVFHLDFAKLSFTAAMSDEELHAECTRFMWAAAEEFFSRYAASLNVDPLLPSHLRAQGKIPYLAVRGLARDHKRRIFLAIDNYTSPFMAVATSFERRLAKDSWCYRMEYAIQRLILALLFVDVGNNTIARGFITGALLPNEASCLTLPFAETFGFTSYTQDFTAAPDCADIVGFTRADIEELVRSFLGVADDQVPTVALRVVPKQFERRVGAEGELEVATYAARQVVDALRGFKASLSD